jgi:hypothetical protein
VRLTCQTNGRFLMLDARNRRRNVVVQERYGMGKSFRKRRMELKRVAIGRFLRRVES